MHVYIGQYMLAHIAIVWILFVSLKAHVLKVWPQGYASGRC